MTCGWVHAVASFSLLEQVAPSALKEEVVHHSSRDALIQQFLITINQRWISFQLIRNQEEVEYHDLFHSHSKPGFSTETVFVV